MAAPCAGVVAQQHVTRVEVSPQVPDLKPGHGLRVGRRRGRRRGKGAGQEEGPPDLELHGLLHGAQVHGNVGGVGDQPPVGPEEGAGEVQALLDVGGDGRALQDAAHLLWRHRVTRRRWPHPRSSSPRVRRARTGKNPDPARTRGPTSVRPATRGESLVPPAPRCSDRSAVLSPLPAHRPKAVPDHRAAGRRTATHFPRAAGAGGPCRPGARATAPALSSAKVLLLPLP